MRRGFSLLELLVAIGLGAMVVMLTAQVFRGALDARTRIREVAAEVGALRRAHELISRDMHSATIPPDDSGLQFGLAVTPAGTGANVLQLAAVVSEPLLTGRASNETALVQYAVAEDPRTGDLGFWRYETPYPVPEGTSPEESGETRALSLVPGVVGAEYLFYSVEQQQWIESWDGQVGLPTAIRIDLIFQGANDGSEPPRESWVFALPAAKFTNDEAAAAELAAEEAL